MPKLEVIGVTGLPEVAEGDNLGALIGAAIDDMGEVLTAGDIIVVAQKVISKQEGRLVQLTAVQPSPKAIELAEQCKKDPRFVELVLRESASVIRCEHTHMIVEHRLGFKMANAGIDQSNVPGNAEQALLLPIDPDRSANDLRQHFFISGYPPIGVIVSDSFGRPWRIGTCGVAIGCSGVMALTDLRGTVDRDGRELRTSEVATADEIAAAASLVMGQSNEGIPVAIVRGNISFVGEGAAADLIRPPADDLFR